MNNTANPVTADVLVQNDYLELVKAASLAPSADNNQPWRFVVQRDHILAQLDRRHALPSDVDSMFDLVALGAALENMRIAAAQLGFVAQITPPPNGASAAAQEPDTAAVLQLARGAEPDPLFDRLASRHTSRKLYAKRTPDARSLTQMAQAVQRFAGVELDWVTSRRAIGTCAKLIAAGDLVRFRAKEFHAELFRQLRFSRAEAQQTRDGLDVRTLELPPGGRRILQCLGCWSHMQWLHRLGLGWTLAAPTWRTVRRSGAIGILSVERSDTAMFLHGGGALQRLWLTADDAGLSLQPLGSLPIYSAHLDRPDDPTLPPQYRPTIRRQLDRLAQLAPRSAGRRLLMIFRVGYAARPRHRSLRRRPDTFIRFQREADRSAPPPAPVTPVPPPIDISVI